jgi:WhiB family transcriptional regulator, redox-sensing transcriptional regulator
MEYAGRVRAGLVQQRPCAHLVRDEQGENTNGNRSAPGGPRADWRDHAACRHCDPELFFPDGDIRAARAQVAAAKKVCRGCPVKRICLNWALADGQEAGIWGGTTEQERRQLRRGLSSVASDAGVSCDCRGPAPPRNNRMRPVPSPG